MRKKNKNSQFKALKILKLIFSVLRSFFIFFIKVFQNLYIFGGVFLFLFLILFFSFFEKGGILGKAFLKICHFLLGKTGTYFFSVSLFLAGVLAFFVKYQNASLYLFFGLLLSFLGPVGFFQTLNLEESKVGFILAFIFSKLFGKILSSIIFFFFPLFSLFLYLFLLPKEKREPVPFLVKKFLIPTFKVEEISPPKEKTIKIEKEPPKEPSKKEEFLDIEYQPPPISLLEGEKGKPLAGDIQENCLIIQKTLENFGIEVEMGEVNVGPTVTQYTLKPAEGVKISRITALTNDLALALAAHPIRIEAPIPGKSLVGIEVPNKTRILVRLKELISHPDFQNSPKPLLFVLGKDVAGHPQFADLSRMPHLLVAGATGTGKTIFLNTVILSLIYKNSPEILKFILIDPKRVEFLVYQDIPHLISPIILDVDKVVKVLNWLVAEMENRFEILAREKVRDIFSFNQKVLSEERPPMPYIVLIIDELADIMLSKGREVENRIVRLAQLARATGIHLILATQRPSVEVLTGLIKANIISRVAFQVASQFDSRTILDVAGAEKLLGKGDLLFLSPESPKPKRIQAPFVSDKEVQRVVNWFKEKNLTPSFDPNLIEILQKEETLEEEEEFFEIEDDPLFEEAKRVVIEARKASASLLQRRLKIGYARAARLLDLLEKRGIIGPPQGSKPREVFLSPKENEEQEPRDDDWVKI